MDYREILTSLLAAAAVTALLAHGFRDVRAQMPDREAAGTGATACVAGMPCPAGDAPR